MDKPVPECLSHGQTGTGVSFTWTNRYRSVLHMDKPVPECLSHGKTGTGVSFTWTNWYRRVFHLDKAQVYCETESDHSRSSGNEV